MRCLVGYCKSNVARHFERDHCEGACGVLSCLAVKKAAGKLPTAPNNIGIVQRDQLPGPLKTADRPTRHRNRTNWHQRILLVARGSLNALDLQG